MGRMTRNDLKSLDVFAFGLVWAELLANKCVLTSHDRDDPPKFRLLEILQRVDQPADSELEDLKFSADVVAFVRTVISGNLEALRPELFGPSWPNGEVKREALMHAPSVGLPLWVRRHALDLPADSCVPDLIGHASKFSYRRRPSTECLINDAYFECLRAEMPPQLWPHQQAPHFDDVAKALHIEQEKQMEARIVRKNVSALTGGQKYRDVAAFGDPQALADCAFVQRVAARSDAKAADSVRKVNEMVRRELAQTRQR